MRTLLASLKTMSPEQKLKTYMELKNSPMRLKSPDGKRAASILEGELGLAITFPDVKVGTYDSKLTQN